LVLTNYLLFFFPMKKTKQNKINPKKLVINPSLRFILLSIFIISILVFISSLNFIQQFLTAFTALSLHSILNALGISVRLVEPIVLQLVHGSQMKFSIIPDCTGIYPAVVLCGFIFAFPANSRKKTLGIFGAIAASFVMNYLRLVSLIALAQVSVRTFEIAHLIIWQSSFIILVIAYFLWWLRWK